MKGIKLINSVKTRLSHWLSQRNDFTFAIYAIVSAFSCYFCMYAFRKPFTASAFEQSPQLFGVDYKIALVLAQLIGYTLSKFFGIKLISEMKPHQRLWLLGGLIGIAQISLLFFAILPPTWGPLCLLINGFPLGMIWGVVFSYLEGRKLTEVLGIGLSASYILASGFVKSVGKWLMGFTGLSEFWMPFFTGLLFLGPFLFFAFMLSALPAPTEEDQRLRSKREPMNQEMRQAFFKTYALGLTALIALFIILTAYRDFRDNFAAEIWQALGYGKEASIFTMSELPVTFGVLIALAFLVKIKDNFMALKIVHGVMIFGVGLLGVSTFMFELELISGAVWMMLVGFGAYLAYVPYGCILFDRLIATVGSVGTAGFLIYLADSFGYAGSIAVNLYKNYGSALSWKSFFISFNYFTSLFCIVCYLISYFYFSSVLKKDKSI
jgi:hypothetical protein